ncbi:F-box/LRR-repeat protein At5g63520-like [Pyrus x bretschneideri]|uniref:F-box/LRR-repeat protein At5g63520-like n=1 Tax=Pyrus x bretschneideri TaxID=225117 RepID=UPI000870AAC3|nr:F-box/LRR-repeat protein At5g63520-like [Pyrus x bretschneideri]
MTFASIYKKKLGSSVPFIISTSSGIFGRDALTHEFKEVRWGEVCGDGSDEDCSIPAKDVTYDILLTVGFVPGLKVDAILLLRTIKVPNFTFLLHFSLICFLGEYLHFLEHYPDASNFVSVTDMKLFM